MEGRGRARILRERRPGRAPAPPRLPQRDGDGAAGAQERDTVVAPADAPRDLRALLADDHVRRVLLGGTPGDPPGALGAAEIREIVGRDATA